MSGMQNTLDEDLLKEAFELFDTDGNGSICTREFGSVARIMGFNPTDPEIESCIKEFDLNKSGKLEFGEFRKWYRLKRDQLNQTVEELTNAFKIFDKNHDGFIDINELKKIMNQMGKPISDSEVAEMIKVADMDLDGMVNYEEFAKFICGSRQIPKSEKNTKSEKR